MKKIKNINDKLRKQQQEELKIIEDKIRIPLIKELKIIEDKIKKLFSESNKTSMNIKLYFNQSYVADQLSSLKYIDLNISVLKYINKCFIEIEEEILQIGLKNLKFTTYVNHIYAELKEHVKHIKDKIYKSIIKDFSGEDRSIVVVDKDILHEYCCLHDIKYDSIKNDETDKVSIICTYNQYLSIRKSEAKKNLDDLIKSKIERFIYEYIINDTPIIEYLHYNFDSNVFYEELRKERFSSMYISIYTQKVVDIFSTINAEIYKKYKLFYECDFFDLDIDQDCDFDITIYDLDRK